MLEASVVVVGLRREPLVDDTFPAPVRIARWYGLLFLFPYAKNLEVEVAQLQPPSRFFSQIYLEVVSMSPQDLR